MGVILDSTVLIAAERRRFDLEGYIASHAGESFATVAVVASELLVGVHRATPQHVTARAEYVEQAFATLPVLPFDLASARVHARLSAELRASGTPVGIHDLLIAATAVALGYRVLTRDQRSFPRVPGLLFEVA